MSRVILGDTNLLEYLFTFLARSGPMSGPQEVAGGKE